jgi:hypothetical protein
MLTIRLWGFLRRLWREDKSFELGAMGGVLLVAFTGFAPLTIPLLIIDLVVWLIVFCVKRARADAVRRAELAQQRQREISARKAAQAAEKSQALARIESEKRADQERYVAAQNAVEPAISDVRRHWANCYELIGDRCSLKDVNDAIERAMTESSAYAALQQLASLKDSMTRDAVRIRTEQLYEKFSPYLSSIVPHEEFDRLMREAVRRSTNVADYGKRLLELGNWLESIAGPAKGRWEDGRQQEQIAAYEKLFADDGEGVAEDPFAEPVEQRRESRAG